METTTLRRKRAQRRRQGEVGWPPGTRCGSDINSHTYTDSYRDGNTYAYTDSDARHAHGDAYGHTYAYADADRFADSHAYRDSHAYTDRLGNGHTDGDRDSRGGARCHAERPERG